MSRPGPPRSSETEPPASRDFIAWTRLARLFTTFGRLARKPFAHQERIDTSQGRYGGRGPSRDKLEAFIRNYLVYDGASVPDELIDLRYQASIDPEVVADPPLRRPSGPMALRTLWRMDLTRDRRLKRLRTPTLVLWGRDDKVNRPAGGPMLLNLMPNAELVMTSRTGHWVQWERADLFNKLVTEFLDNASVFAQ